MIDGNGMVIRPRRIRLEASTVCQLKCPACPTATGEIGRHLGNGFLEVEVLAGILERNPWITDVELSNWGEIFLNPKLVDLLRYCQDRDVAVHAMNGANLNDVEEDVLEALVRYGLRDLTCSLDGASQETYSTYRVNGDFQRVTDNIRKINGFKAGYGSRYPKLRWQYIAFGHNEHEIDQARKMAEELKMGFYVKLSWEDLYTKSFSSVKNFPLIRSESGLGAASRDEYRNRYGKEYAVDCCHGLWSHPQINYDGRVLGCSVNHWDDYGNALNDGLLKCMNGDKMAYAREMLLGRRKSKEGIPCSGCKLYGTMRERKQWVAEEDVAGTLSLVRSFDPFERSAFGFRAKRRLTRISSSLKRRIPTGWLGSGGAGTCPEPRLTSRMHPLQVPLRAEEGKGWTPHHLFKGSAKGLPELACHASVLMPGHCPHDPHMHKEEELLVLLSGEVDLIVREENGSGGGHRARRLKAGQFAYYPSNFAHTLRAAGDAPANYLMLKWHGPPGKNGAELPPGFFGTEEFPAEAGDAERFRTRVLFEGPTKYLRKLHCHVSALAPGGGYAPHADGYDVAVVLLRGTVETLGGRVEPHGVVFYAAGEPHGMHNPGKETAGYLVFEFHGR